jgi:hypothetical protein
MSESKTWCHDCYCWHNTELMCPEYVQRRSAAADRSYLIELGIEVDEGDDEHAEDDEMTTYFDIPICTQPLSGGSNDYYKVQVSSPTSGGDAYTAECNDIIEALQMTYAEGNAFKALWRHALARRGIGKQGNTQKYEAEKVEFFAKRLVEQAS